MTNSLLGVRIAERYIIDSRLGAGGMGQVYLGRDLASGKQRAIKVLTERRNTTPKAIARFRREARILLRLKHLHIVRLFEHGDQAGVGPYLVLEYVEGVRLDHWARRFALGQRMLPMMVTILAQVANALAYAHRLDIVHRDLKPNNVLLVGGKPEAVKLIDYGLSRLHDDVMQTSLTEENELVGTPAFMSPEQCRCVEAGPAADIYSLAATAYALIAGRPPFMADTPEEMILAHSYAEAPPIRDLPECNVVPRDLERLLLACLSKQSQDRPDAPSVCHHLRILAQDLASEGGVAGVAGVVFVPSADIQPQVWSLGRDGGMPDTIAAQIFKTPSSHERDQQPSTRLREALRNQISSTMLDLAQFLRSRDRASEGLRAGLAKLQQLDETLTDCEIQQVLTTSESERDPHSAQDLAVRLRRAHRETFVELYSQSDDAPSKLERRLFATLDGLVGRFLGSDEQYQTP